MIKKNLKYEFCILLGYRNDILPNENNKNNLFEIYKSKKQWETLHSLTWSSTVYSF